MQMQHDKEKGGSRAMNLKEERALKIKEKNERLIAYCLNWNAAREDDEIDQEKFNSMGWTSESDSNDDNVLAGFLRNKKREEAE